MKLYDIIKITKGKKADQLLKDQSSGAVRFIQIDDLRNNDNLKYTLEKGVSILTSDLIIAWDGANAGIVGYGLEGIIGSTLARLEITNDNIYPPFLGKFLQSQSQYIRKHTTGATIPHVNKEILLNIEIPNISYGNQKRIVTILDEADLLRQKRKQSIKLLDEYIKAVFIDMFGDPQTNPKSWPVKKLGDLTKISSGSTPSREHEEYYNGDIPWVKTTEVNGHLILKTQEYISEAGLKNSSCHLYPKNSIIVAMYGQGKTRGQVGILGIEATTNQACGVLYPNESYNTVYIFKLLQYSYDNLRSLGRGGNQPNLNTGIIKNYQVIFPPIELQIKYSVIVQKTETLKQKMTVQSIELDNQFQALMQKSFNLNN